MRSATSKYILKIKKLKDEKQALHIRFRDICNKIQTNNTLNNTHNFLQSAMSPRMAEDIAREREMLSKEYEKCRELKS